MKKRSVEIVVPAYNEEKELAQNITTLYLFCKESLKTYDWHITIADNASSDNTPVIAANLANKYPHITHFRLEQKGRGRAVKRVWSASKADFCLYMDLDLSTDIKHIPDLLYALEHGYDIAIGSRLAKGSEVEGRTLVRELTSRVLNYVFIRFIFQTNFTDAQCGFKGVTKQIVENIIPYVKDNDWFFDGELLIVAEKSGYKIYDIPVHWIDNPGSTVRLLSTISNDLKAMWLLLLRRPWESLKRK